jgi:hypothetical protein
MGLPDKVFVAAVVGVVHGLAFVVVFVAATRCHPRS